LYPKQARYRATLRPDTGQEKLPVSGENAMRNFGMTGTSPPSNPVKKLLLSLFWGNFGGMAGVGGAPSDSLRFSGLESRRLALAFTLSLAAHLLGWGGCELGKQLGVQRWLHLPVLAITIQPVRPSDREPEPLVFVEVNPEQATADAPKNTKYYSSQNSLAANPEADRNKNVPQLNGKQTEIVRTEDVPRPNFSKLQPAAPQTNPQPEARRPMLDPGDLTLAKLGDSQQQERPRTLKQANTQQNRLPGPQMKQEGGVHRQALVTSLDVKATPFGAYDKAFIEAVTQRWYDLLDNRQFARDRSGKVVLQFHLNYDGRISDMDVRQNTVGDMLGYVCQKAVMDPAPYAKWPTDMRVMMDTDYREITFTFYYY
jgi:hypothetical protein